MLFFIEIGTRRIRVAGATRNPDSAWVTQQARNLASSLDDREAPVRFLIHDRDSKFPGSFDEVFATEDVEVILTPIRAPSANPFAERWVRSVRRELLDWTLVLGRRHLNRLLQAYVEHYNSHRAHRGIDLAAPDVLGRDPSPVHPKEIHRRELLDGLIHEYHGLRRDDTELPTPSGSTNQGFGKHHADLATGSSSRRRGRRQRRAAGRESGRGESDPRLKLGKLAFYH